MQISATKTKNLILIDRKGHPTYLKNKIMRKWMDTYQQRMSLSINSILIVCNYGFNNKKHNYSTRVQAICHPFRSDKNFPSYIPSYNLSESDFCDKIWIYCKEINIEKKYDLLYFTLNSHQGSKCKGFHCLPLLADIAEETGLKIKVIDYSPENVNEGKKKKYSSYSSHSAELSMWQTRDHMERCKEILDIQKAMLNEKQLNKLIRQSKISFFPNTKDASPRMISESLIRGVPILVNENIWGGWKYVNKTNGMFFKFPQTYSEYKNGESEYKKTIISKIEKMMNHDYISESIQKDYYDVYGFKNTARKLAKIFNRSNRLGDRFEYAIYEDFEPYLGEFTSCSPKSRLRRNRIREETE